jgi:hypothetical protein
MSPLIPKVSYHPTYYSLVFRIERVCGLIILSAIVVVAFMILISVVVEGKKDYLPLHVILC